MTADPGENEVLGDLAPGGLNFEVDIEPMASPRSPASSTSTPHTFHTESDSHDLFCEYHGGFPSYDPENSMSLDHLSDGPTFHRAPASPLSSPCKNYFAPFLNATTWRLINWFYSSSPQKSLQDLDCLVQDVILADDFDRDDLHNFSAHRETKRLDDAPRNSSSSLFSADGWCTTSIPIRLPCEKVKRPEVEAPIFHVEGLHYCPITEVVKSAFEEPAAATFHPTPYKLYWQPDKTWSPEHVFTELYTSDAMLREHEKIKCSPKNPGCNLETVIAAIMLWSDSTHLASFGNAALWPIYLFLGNQSKYTRAKPTAFTAHHLAYIPKVCISHLVSCILN